MTPRFASDRPVIPWAAAPLLLPAAAVGGGIGVAAGLDYGFATAFGALSVGAWLFALALHLRPRPTPRRGTLSSLFLLLALFGFGGWYAAERHPLNQPDHFSHQLAAADLVTGEVTSVRPGARRTAVEVEVSALVDEQGARPASGKLLAYVTGGDSLEVGDQLLLSVSPERIPPPLNPEVFDYGAYLAGRSIYHRAYADAGEWLTVGDAPRRSLATLADRSRNAWFSTLTPYLQNDDLAVAAALIMGKRDLLGAEVRSAYADTGAIHVLAVSGLHVGILALIVVQLLGWLPRRPLWTGLRTVVTLAAVWYFALVTGLSASVQRAALMVSIVVVGKTLNRNNSIFNLLAIAALVMLLIQPKQLFQVGFQLSFAAVTGIALFARPLSRLLYLPGVLSRGWDAISVSTAAQLGTLPFALYYFGQFPVYFLLSGTLVIVFAYAVLGLGLLHGLLAMVGVGGAGLWLTGSLLQLVVGLQNAFIFFCQQLPGATLRLTDFSLVSAVGLLLLIACGAYLAFRPSHRARWVALGLGGTLGLCWLLGPVVWPAPPQFTVYHLPRTTLIDVFDGRSGLAIGDTVEEGQLDYQVAPLRRKLGVEFTAPLPFAADTSRRGAAIAYPLLRLLDWRVLVLDGEWPAYPDTAQWPAADLLLVRNGYRPHPLPRALATAPIVVDGSNAPYRARDWRRDYPAAHLTAEEGAYRYRRR
ncbi:competence protein ComEC [Lewinella marina]|uniref:ComEC/Rec2 family competence protein n=1 Tax=Neolewinella marina TaxID=438751 RepID=UPI0014305629|nr:ComEC/Rec2 family competence protein [Neolewinella marina]NJB87350.1 competence protein ComEC [Neolewinella marina]